MEMKKIFLVLADISGYTEFIKLHKISLLHAEEIISELLESVIKESSTPLVLHELEGDAVVFYAESDGSQAMAQDIYRQAQQFFEGFRKKEGELISDCRVCSCEACAKVGQLKLKIIMHHGRAVFNKIRHFTKISGEDVILAHRLLKNSIPHKEYLLITDGFYQILGEVKGMIPEQRCENCEGLGPINVMVHYPEKKRMDIVPPKRTFWSKAKMVWRLDLHMIKRIFIPPKKFHHLQMSTKH
ncbi:DUF2652 domain-containing protein [Rapidithrix thailandica]|uniref:DUF2652 domain-containing protein n=1 Tax=Rapidithrix thailandica TaxID=413964 RepID=A0AAW9SE88_9BACT